MTSFYPGHANATQVGTYFVCQYYQILQQQPDSVHQFYTNLSSMVRSDGAATESAQGMLQIHNLVICLNFNGIEIKTAHFLESWNGGVLVMVSGYVQLKEYSIRRKFVQTFFLAPQEKGYFVLNDIFHFLEEEHVHQLPESVLDHGDFETKQDATNSLPEPEENDSSDNNTIDEVPQEFPVCDEREDETPPEERTMTHPNAINNLRDLSPTAEEPVAEAGRQTYASILQAKGQAGPHPTSLTKNSLVAPDRHHKPPPTTQQLRSALVTEKSSSMSLDEALLVEDEGFYLYQREERSVYVGNLPSSISTSDLEQEFKNFGRLKPDGVSIRSRKEAGVFYAFIEYEDATGVQNALKASPIQLNGRLIHVEERRPNGGASRGRRSRGRGGYQSEVPRGRFGGRSFGRVVAQEIGDKDYNSRLRGNGNLQRGPRQQRGILGSQAPRNGHNPAEALF
ncbi:nuclear transport factor 2 isoform X1 [Musa acuminata AAA Group]|uniref:G3BP-like protein n=1 Tax=Musa acuminata subsp. malaccensis TaxID=214687 RepID=A0A804L3E4_MUSAM|nr:PREDICTED: putative G3BP-like protein isoform X1 [Musa acuminata subsp. malaccensis]